MQQVQLTYLQHEEIDRSKWDTCIRFSLNSRIYAYSCYLDTMSDQWDALVYGDYEAVMPITWRKKFGIRYLYQPAFMQQLGVFSPVEVPKTLIEQFIFSAKKRFRFCEIFLNEGNVLESISHNDFSIFKRTNYTLTLDRTHENIVDGFKDTMIQDINKAVRHGLVYVNNILVSTIINANKDYLNRKSIPIHNADFIHFNLICDRLKAKEMCLTRGVKNVNGDLLAQVILLKDHGRIYNIMSVTTPEGRELRANHLLYNSILNEFQNSGLIFDFEGSDLPGVREFYKSFGAINRPYYFLKYNELPWYMKMVKK